jgi:hypothetical protein
MAKQTKSIAELALELTQSNLVKSRSSRKSINSYLVDILGTDSKTKKTRIELTNEITMLRLEESEVVNAESFQDAEFIARFTKMNKTVKNGLDTSIASGKSASCFISSSFATDWELIKNSDKTYSMKSLSKK